MRDTEQGCLYPLQWIGELIMFDDQSCGDGMLFENRSFW